MTKEEIYEFFQKSLILIENAELLLKHIPSRHIPAFHKILGIQQKFERLTQDDQRCFFSQIIAIRGTIAYFLNGRYEEGIKNLEKLKKEFIIIALDSSENNKNK